MWIIGAGVMVAGLVSLSFVSLYTGGLIIAAGAAIAMGCELRTEKKAAQARHIALSNYPSYKY